MKAKEYKIYENSRYGSHGHMVVKDNEDGTVVCKDLYGEYTTQKWRVDNNMADPNRSHNGRMIQKES